MSAVFYLSFLLLAVAYVHGNPIKDIEDEQKSWIQANLAVFIILIIIVVIVLGLLLSCCCCCCCGACCRGNSAGPVVVQSAQAAGSTVVMTSTNNTSSVLPPAHPAPYGYDQTTGGNPYPQQVQSGYSYNQ